MLENITQLTSDKTNKYELFSCKSGNTAIFVWGQEVVASDYDYNAHEICGCIWRSWEQSPTFFNLGELDYYESILSLKEYSSGMYALIIESKNTSRIILFDSTGTINRVINYPHNNIVIRCYQAGNNAVLFCYDSTDRQFLIQATDLEWENEMTTINTYYDVEGIPEVFIDASDNYTCAWLNHNIISNTKTLYIVRNNVFANQPDNTRVIHNFNVEYLISSRVDDDWIVFGGYDDISEMMRFEFCSYDTDGIVLYDRYVKSMDYDSHTYSLEALDSGFILLGDGPERNSVCAQRWNHLATPVYPVLDLEESDLPSWNPTALQIGETIVVGYLQDYDDYDELCIGTMTIGEEINKLDIWDLC